MSEQQGPYYRLEPIFGDGGRSPSGYMVVGRDSAPISGSPFLGPANVLRDACNRAHAAGVASERATTAAFLREVREVLEAHRYNGYSGPLVCEACKQSSARGCAPDCRLAALLAKMKENPDAR